MAGPQGGAGPAGPVVLLLGPVELRDGDAPAVLGGGAKVRAILAQLALAEGRVVSTDALIDGLWGEEPPATADNTLQYHVGVLRKAFAAIGLDGAITTKAPGYLLRCPTDVAAFERLRGAAQRSLAADRADRAATEFEAALALWRGPALADLRAYPFASGMAVALEEQRLQMTESLVDCELDLGRSGEVVARLEILVTEHPTRERFWDQLMVALYRTGRQADALDAYGRARRLLQRDLGVEPSPALRARQAAILAQDASLLGATPSRPVAALPLLGDLTRLRTSIPTRVAALVLSDGGTVTLDSRPVVVGRHEGCEVILAGERVSRRHARISPTVDGHAIEDLGSTNGSFVNGVRVIVPTQLGQGDRIGIGDHTLRYELLN